MQELFEDDDVHARDDEKEKEGEYPPPQVNTEEVDVAQAHLRPTQEHATSPLTSNEMVLSPLIPRLQVAVPSTSHTPVPGPTPQRSPRDAPIKAAEAIYFTEKLKEWHDRSSADFSGRGRKGFSPFKRLEKLLDKSKQGVKEDSKALIDVDAEPRGLRKRLQSMGKEELMNIIVGMTKKLDELGESGESKALLEAVRKPNTKENPLALHLSVPSYLLLKTT